MSTLVSILLAMVLNLLPTGTFQQDAKDVSKIEEAKNTESIKDLRSQYLISKDELALANWEEQLN